jgi:hypothetical protein
MSRTRRHKDPKSNITRDERLYMWRVCGRKVTRLTRGDLPSRPGGSEIIHVAW